MNIERISFGNADITFQGSDEDDLLEVFIDVGQTATGYADFTTDGDGTPGPSNTRRILFTNIVGLTFNSMAGNDELKIHNPTGDLFSPTANDVIFNAGDDSDLLQVLGGNGSTGSYTVGPGADKGTLIAVDSG